MDDSRNVVLEILEDEDTSFKSYKKEIHNIFGATNNANGNGNNTNSIAKNDFIKKPEKKPEVIEEIIIDDDANEDWSAVPAFLRRNKK